jgi:hypothetical protein
MITPDSETISRRNVAKPLDVTNSRRNRDFKEHGIIPLRCDKTDGYSAHTPSSGVVVDEHGLALGDCQGKTYIVAVEDVSIPELNAL